MTSLENRRGRTSRGGLDQGRVCRRGILPVLLAVAVCFHPYGPAIGWSSESTDPSVEPMTPAPPAWYADYVRLLEKTAPRQPGLPEAVTFLLEQSVRRDELARRAEPALMVVGYHERDERPVDVVVQLIHDSEVPSGSHLNQQGYVQERLGDDLFGSADRLMSLFYRQVSWFGEGEQAGRHQRAFRAGLNGDLTLLREQTIDPLRLVAIMPRPQRYLPGSLGRSVQAMILEATLAFGRWDSRVTFVADDEPTAKRVAVVVDLFREMAVLLAAQYASDKSGRPLREALDESSVQVAANQVVAQFALPSSTVVRVAQEFSHHGGGCPPGGVCPRNKVAVCHKDPGKPEKTLCVAPSAVPAHLAHGDTCGPCP